MNWAKANETITLKRMRTERLVVDHGESEVFTVAEYTDTKKCPQFEGVEPEKWAQTCR